MSTATEVKLHYHPGSGNRLIGRILNPGETVLATDCYDDYCGGWLLSREEDIGQTIAVGCTTQWVRPKEPENEKKLY